VPNLTPSMSMMLQYPQLVTQLVQGGAALGGATAGQPYYLNAPQPYSLNAGRQVQSVQATCSMRLPGIAPPRQIADLAAQAGTPTMPPPPAAAAAAVASAAAAAPPPPAPEPRADDYLRPRPARPAEPAQPLAQPAPMPAMRPPAFATAAALGSMSHWFSPPAFAKLAPAAPAPLPAAAPSDQARCYSKPHANPVPAHRRATAHQASAQLVRLDSGSSEVGLRGDLSPRISVSHLAALSAVPDAALSAQFAAAALQREQINAASPGAPHAAPTEPPARPNHDVVASFAHPPHALPTSNASPFAAPPGGCGAAAAQQPASTTPAAISPTWLLDSLTVEEFLSLRSSRERELSSRELVDLTGGANSSDSTLLEDAGRLNLSSFNGLAGLLDAL